MSTVISTLLPIYSKFLFYTMTHESPLRLQPPPPLLPHHAIRHTLHVTRHTPHATRYTPHATCHTPHTTCPMPHTTRHTLHTTCHTPHATCFTGHATCQPPVHYFPTILSTFFGIMIIVLLIIGIWFFYRVILIQIHLNLDLLFNNFFFYILIFF